MEIEEAWPGCLDPVAKDLSDKIDAEILDEYTKKYIEPAIRRLLDGD